MKALLPVLPVSLALAFIAQDQAHASLVVAPNATATTEGNNGNYIVLGTTAGTIQTQYAASQLSGMSVGSQITAIWLRTDGSETAGPASDVSYSDYEVTLAQANNAIGSFSSTFANNMLNPQLAYDGALTIPANTFTGGAGPHPFEFKITLQTPYTYQGGDLVLLVTNPTRTGQNFLADYVSSGMGFGTDFTGCYTSGFQATTGGPARGLPVQFEFTAVPEPSAWATMAGAGLLGMAAWRRRQPTAA